jgi:hypothetical protein
MKTAAGGNEASGKLAARRLDGVLPITGKTNAALQGHFEWPTVGLRKSLARHDPSPDGDYAVTSATEKPADVLKPRLLSFDFECWHLDEE